MKKGLLSWRRAPRPPTMSARGTLNAVTGLVATGVLLVLISGGAMGSLALGVELAARLSFVLALLLAARPWMRQTAPTRPDKGSGR